MTNNSLKALKHMHTISTCTATTQHGQCCQFFRYQLSSEFSDTTQSFISTANAYSYQCGRTLSCSQL